MDTFLLRYNSLKYDLLKLLFSFFISGSCLAQSTITFDAGQVFSTYKYTDSQGEIKDFSKNISGCFSLGYQYMTNSSVFIRANLGMRKGGASLEFNEMNVEWNVQYTDASIGVGYMLNKWRVKPYLSVSPYYAYALKGVQTVGQDKYDILKNKTMSPMDFGIYAIPGLRVDLSNTISFYAEYRYIYGLQNLETSSGNGQKTYNRGFSINLGIAVSIIKYNYVTTQ